LHGFGRSPGECCSQLGRSLEKLRGLAPDDVEIGRFVERRVAGIHELQHFALGDYVGRVRQDIEHMHRADSDHQLERAGIEKVAHQHRRRVAECRIGSRDPATELGFVDNVVVQKRRCVNHFDDGGQRVVVTPNITAGSRGDDDERRTQALAATLDDVLGHLPNENDVRFERLVQHAVDLCAVGRQHRIEGILRFR
jgi:hypothetical protein